MKQLLAYLFLTAFFLLAACSNSGKETISADDLQKIKIIPFSDSLRADTFKIEIEGSKPAEMQLAFTINSFEGKQIYSTKIQASDLFKNYDATINLSKKNNQIKFLKEEMIRFFDEENFMEPAITEQENPDQYVPDKKFYDELKQSQLNGFAYRLGKDRKIYIAWSGSQNKVIPYYICCE